MTALRRHALALLLLAPAARAADPPMQVIETRPAARSVMDGNRQEVFVRFDGPVDHHASRLALLQGDRLVRQLEPRLTASPDTLYAIAGGLAPGAYVLRWEAKSRRDGRMSEGQLDFTVR
jgi:methionine-rich copper-binding protein CopC